MRIIQTIPNFKLGGVQKAGQVLADAMYEQGHEVALVGFGDGPRARLASDKGPEYVQFENQESWINYAAAYKPDVIHMHVHRYEMCDYDRLAECPALSSCIVVTTPVFGRPPRDRSVLAKTKTCCVGDYCLYRLLKWLDVSPDSAAAQGFGCVPLTPFQPPMPMVSSLDPWDVLRERRLQLGIRFEDLVVGRIGRDNPLKWDPDTKSFIDRLLDTNRNVTWVSIGMPKERGREELKERWHQRFINFPETPDYNFLCNVLSALDLQFFSSRMGECFASSICEPAGLGVPTIARSTPLFDNGQSEQVIDGITGYLASDSEHMLDLVKCLALQTTELDNLKKSTFEHAHRYWSMDVVAANLLSLYRFWLNGGNDLQAFPYVHSMTERSRDFSLTYFHRMLDLHGKTAFKRLSLYACLMAAENWRLFQMARDAKNLMR